jgi:DNA-binding GntR family transcriptional regulator
MRQASGANRLEPVDMFDLRQQLADLPRTWPLTRVLERSVARNSLVFSIAHAVGASIIQGALLPGASISSVAIARAFDTSRAPVRDALIILEREGLLEVSNGRAARVIRMSLDEVRKVYEVRAALHTLIAERIVKSASDQAIADLRRGHCSLIELAEAGDVDGYFWSNIEFRDAEARAAGNDIARQVLDSLGLRTLLARHISLSLPDRLRQSVSDHARLIAAYETRNALLAVAITRTIVYDGLAAIEGSWSTRLVNLSTLEGTTRDD